MKYSPWQNKSFIVCYHTTKAIFGKDQRMPATRYISYPTLSVSLTHYIRQWVHIFMSMRAYNDDAAYHSTFSPSHADTLMYFLCKQGRFEQVVLLVFEFTFNTLCRIKIILFCSLKMVRQFKGILTMTYWYDKLVIRCTGLSDTDYI